MTDRACSNCVYITEALDSKMCAPCNWGNDKMNFKPKPRLVEAQIAGEPLPINPMPESIREYASALPLVRGNQLPEDDALRGQYPMADGCLDYFPNALAEVSRISFEGNQKHNPGQPMHWARDKSTDHRNKIIRHTVDSRDDTEAAIEHAAQAAWRSLALLQEKIETVRGIQVSGASK